MKFTAIAFTFALACLVAGQRFPSKPLNRIADEAEILTSADRVKIRHDSNLFVRAHGAPIVVATIPSLKAEHAAGLTIDRYARVLFDQWGIGSQQSNFGILVVVSKGDRQARIEMGEAWNHQLDQETHDIMSEKMVPNFKVGRYSKGIVSAVEALQKFSPKPPTEEDPDDVPVTIHGVPVPFPTGIDMVLGVMCCPFVFIAGVFLFIAATSKGKQAGRRSVQMRNGQILGQGVNQAPDSTIHGGGSDAGGGGGGADSGSSSGGFDGGSGGGGGDTGSW